MVQLGRRDLLRLGVAVFGTGVAAGAGSSVAAAAKPGGGGGAATSRNALRVPPVLATSTTITAAPTRVQIGGPNRMSDVLAYAGSVPGPTFVVPRGGGVDVTVQNGLSVPTMTHWHGLVVPTAHDGQPQDPIAPGAARTYALRLPAGQPGGLSFYHPHPHLQTGSQVYMGLAGAFLVRDPREEQLGLPAGAAQEVPLVVRDASFDSAGNLTYGGKASGFLGSTPMVNGTLDPFLDVARGTYRFRIVNAATARIFRLVLSNGAAFTLIGNDGGLLPTAASLTSIDLCPGERADVLVDTSRWTTPVHLRCASAGWTLLELRPTAEACPVVPALPPQLAPVEALVQTGASRRFSFDGMTRINGRLYDHNRIDFTAAAGQVERWTFVTNGNAPHPVHVHGASYQVQSRRGGRGVVFPWERGWKDTLLLHDREQVDVLVRFDTWQAGERYLIHCHKLEHEDAGMMSAFDVA
jgi:FtsP/CotA-like multicopper oxidase with cupredoxin domain